MYTVDRAEDYIDVDERLCSFIDDDDCRATFVYGYHNLTGKNFVKLQHELFFEKFRETNGYYITI